MKRGLIVGAVAVIVMILGMEADVQGVQGDKVPTTKQIMKGCMKSGLWDKVSKGNGTDADKAKALKLLSALADNKAPAGTDDANWKKMTAAIKTACKTGDVEKVKAVMNCKACHTEYKGK